MTDTDLSSSTIVAARGAHVALVPDVARLVEDAGAQRPEPTRGAPAARVVDMKRGAAELYRRYAPNILRRARAILGDAEEARDVVHEVFVKALGGDIPCDAEQSPMTWLYRVTTNHCIDLLRVRSRRGALLKEHGRVLAPHAASDDDARATLRRVLERVPDELKEVAVHFYVDEMTQDEIAVVLGCARRTVGYRLTRFRELAAVICREHLSESRV